MDFRKKGRKVNVRLAKVANNNNVKDLDLIREKIKNPDFISKAIEEIATATVENI